MATCSRWILFSAASLYARVMGFPTRPPRHHHLQDRGLSRRWKWRISPRSGTNASFLSDATSRYYYCFSAAMFRQSFPMKPSFKEMACQLPSPPTSAIKFSDQCRERMLHHGRRHAAFHSANSPSEALMCHDWLLRARQNIICCKAAEIHKQVHSIIKLTSFFTLHITLLLSTSTSL